MMKSLPVRVLAVGALGGALLVVLLTVLLGESDPTPGPRWGRDFAASLLVVHLALAFILVDQLRRRPAEEASGLIGPVLGSFTLVGLGLRLIHLGRYAYGNDETLFLFAAAHPTLGESVRDMLTHFHPPTNFLLIRLLLSASWDPVWVRMPAVIGGTLAIPLTYVAIREMFGKGAGLIAAFLVTYSPNLILLSQVCRNYSPALPFYLLAIGMLARHLRNGSMRSLLGFAVFEFLSVIWHYAFLPVFLGANALLFLRIATRPRPLPTGIRAVAAQIPVGVIYVAAILFHQPLTQAGQQEKVRGYMVEEFNLNPLDPLDPVVELFRYLLGDSPAMGAFVLSMAFVLLAAFGAYRLARNGAVWQVALCLAFLPFSYLFAFALHALPFGGTRHSYFAFPFLFALISGALAWIPGSPAVPADSHQRPEGRAGAGSPAGVRMAPAVLVVLFCGFYLFTSMRLYSDVAPYYLRQSPSQKEPTPYYKASFYKVVELPTRRDDIRRLERGIRTFSQPGEIVLTTITTQMLLRAHLMEEPAAMTFDTGRAAEFEWEGRRFVYLPEIQFVLTPDLLLVTVEAVARRYGARPGGRVWVASAGWETWPGSLPTWTQSAYPDVYVDEGAAEGTADLLFAVRVDRARDHTRAILEFGPPESGGPVPDSATPGRGVRPPT